MITGKCDVCGDDILPAANQAQFNRNLGLHKKVKHKIAGQSSFRTKRAKEAHAKGILHEKCGQPGCKYVAESKDATVVRRLIGYHRSTVHGIRGVNWDRNHKNKLARQRLLRKQAAETANGQPQNRMEDLLSSPASEATALTPKKRKVTLTCDQPGCNFQTKSKKQSSALRVLNRHKSMVHGIRGKNFHYQQKYNKRKELGQQPAMFPTGTMQSSNAIEAHLAECPNCRTRFYMVPPPQLVEQG